MQSMDIVLKCIKAVSIYNMLGEGVPKSNGTWGKIQVVITSGGRDEVRQGILFYSNYIYRNKIFVSVISSVGKESLS